MDTERQPLSEENLSCCIDWVQFTIGNEFSADEIWEKLLKIPKEFAKNLSQRGFKGYKIVFEFSHIQLLYSDYNAHYMVKLSGQACRTYELFLDTNQETWVNFFERMLQWPIHMNRIDIAIDDRKTYFDIGNLITKVERRECKTKFKKTMPHGNLSAKDGQYRGRSIYFGSRASLIYFCFYEKGYEKAEKFFIPDEKIDKNWNRYELRFRQEKATALLREMVKRKEIFPVALAVLNDYVCFLVKDKKQKNKSRWSVWQPWQIFMQDAGKISLSVKPRNKDLESLLSWLMRSVAPSLKILREVDEELGQDTLNYMIENCKKSANHHYLVNLYVNQGKVLLANKKEFQ